MSILIPQELNPLKFLISVYRISRKDQCLQDLVKKSENSKIRILFIVWSQCVHQCLNSYTKILRMLKIEYLFINNLSFRVGVLFLPVL